MTDELPEDAVCGGKEFFTSKQSVNIFYDWKF